MIPAMQQILNDMRISEIIYLTKKKAKVLFEGGSSLVLYSGEIKKLDWHDGDEVPADTYDRVRNETVLKRARLYAMHLLQDQDRTEKELMDKLTHASYDDDIAIEALAYVKKFGYVDDERYAEHYINRNKNTRSRRAIRQELMKRGVAQETVTQMLDDAACEEDEYTAIARLLKKRHYHPVGESDEDTDCPGREEAQRERDKQLRYLASKGFPYSAVRYVFEHWDEFE